MYLSVKFFLLLLIFGFSKCFSQTSNESKEYEFGFLLKSNINMFTIKTNGLDSKIDNGIGVGYFLWKEINDKIKLDAEAQLNFERHTFLDNQTEYKIKAVNIAIPLKIHYKLYKELHILGGVEYLRLISRKNEIFNLKENNFNTLFGFSYLIGLKNIKIVPVIDYKVGLNNLVKSIELPNNGGNTIEKSSITLTIKIM